MINKTKSIRIVLAALSLLFVAAICYADLPTENDEGLLKELTGSGNSILEELLEKKGAVAAEKGFATYYASRFEGRRTTSGERYNSRKLTAAHQSLPMGATVRVVNPATGQDVTVTINDRCAPRSFPFIDLSRAAAGKIGLLGKGTIKVIMIPLAESSSLDKLEARL